MRLLNAVLAAVALILLILTARPGWTEKSAGNRFLWLGLGSALFASFYGSIEQVLTRAIGGWRSALWCVATIYLIIAFVSKRRGDWWEDLPEQKRLDERRNQ